MGSFTISLDFELFWGVRDVKTLNDYGDNIIGVWEVIPRVLKLFEEYQIHATWGVVGFINFYTFNDIEWVNILPKYKNSWLSPYSHIISMQEFALNYEEEEIGGILNMHFAPQLIELIANTPHQEIATHTYSHYYIDEKPIIPQAFELDVKKAIDVFKRDGYDISSLIIPRNHTDRESIKVLNKTDIKRYRGNPEHWAYRNGESGKNIFIRAFRLLDTYINLSGSHGYRAKRVNNLTELKSSIFLRPYSKRLRALESLKIKRVKDAMSEVAKSDKNFHLWWHPHNFGVNIEENLSNLEEILKHFRYLNQNYGMKSLNMQELDNES